MIASLSGKVSRLEEDHLVLVVGGIGFQVFAPVQTLAELTRGDGATLFTNLVVREDSLTLYGFQTPDEVTIFELLLRVNGVGPRLALETLSTHSPDVIRRGVINKDQALFSQVSGIGSKTAQKIILTLEDRVILSPDFERKMESSEIDMDVQEALVALGYSVVEAQSAIQRIPDEVPDDLESQLTSALRYFS